MPTRDVGQFVPNELVALRADLVVVIPVTVAAGQGSLPAGRAMGIITASGKAGAYDNAATDGRQTCIGFLAHDVDASTTDVSAGLIVGGYLRKTKLVGLDAAGEADLGATTLPGGILKF